MIEDYRNDPLKSFFEKLNELLNSTDLNSDLFINRFVNYLIKISNVDDNKIVMPISFEESFTINQVDKSLKLKLSQLGFGELDSFKFVKIN